MKVVLRADNARDRMRLAWQAVCQILQHPDTAAKVVVEEARPTRTLEQNDKLWAILRDIAAQVEWPVDGKRQLLDPEDWKHILSAGLKRQQRVAQGIDGGFVILGQRTSRMTIQQMTDLIDLAQAFGTEHNVRWTA